MLSEAQTGLSFYAQQEDSIVSKDERLFTAEKGAYMTRMALATFRAKVSTLGIKGTKQGVRVFYTREQLETIYKGKVGKSAKVAKAEKRVKKTSKRVKK